MTFYNTTNETKAPSARIPERLRKYAKVHEGYLDRAKGASNRRRKHHAHKARVLRKAANEIDHLRAELDEVREIAIWMSGCGYDFTQHDCWKEVLKKLSGE